MSEIINILSNLDFAGFDKFRLRTSLAKIKERRVKMNTIKKSKRNDSCMSDFLSSPFSPIMADLTAGSSDGESASLYTDIGQKRFSGK